MNSKVVSKILLLLGLFIYIFILILTLRNIISGNIAFWYDPARDLLLGVGNLQKPTLIGPPAGIPEIFYGPYWIWMISIGLFFSKDPRIVTIIILLLPYFIIMPFLLWKMKQYWGMPAVIIIGSLFLLNFNGYAKQLWNPHPAPLFFLIFVYILAVVDFINLKRRDLLKLLLAGFFAGLLVNVHISFGIGITAGVIIFFIIECIRSLFAKKKKKISQILIPYLLSIAIFYIGVGMAFLPFLLFESRHGFNQVHAALKTILNPYATVGVLGLSDELIISHFIGVFYRLTGFTRQIVSVVALLFIIDIFYIWYKKRTLSFSVFDIRTGVISIASCITILAIYLNSKNPVWEYHFIGVEILFLFLIAIIASKFVFIRSFLLIWIVYLLILQLQIAAIEFKQNKIQSGTLAAKQSVVEGIIRDAGGTSYEVLAYSPAIYTYDYDYIFFWKANKSLKKDLKDISYNKPIYLIVPKGESAKTQDYINAQTRNVHSKKIKEWYTKDKTRIIKLEHIK